MPASDRTPVAEAEAWLRAHRPRVTPFLEDLMSNLESLIANGKTLAAERVALIADRDAEKARADAAEAHAADLQARIDADDKAAADAAADLDAEIAKESGVADQASVLTQSAGRLPIDGEPIDPSPADLMKPLQFEPIAPAAPVTTTSPSGATVTVDPAAGTTTHVDPVAGITTTVPHDGSAPTATDASGASVEPAPAVVAESTQAATDAGVTVAPAAPALQPAF